MRTLAKRFVKKVMSHYKKHGRHTLPWRNTRDPYRILVSEMMLQQTQVLRVIPYHHVFLKKFPTAKTLAAAPLSAVFARVERARVQSASKVSA